MVITWKVKYSVVATASLDKVWEFHSNIEKHWRRIEGDAVESITLNGPYQAGTIGTTKMPGQEPIEWHLVDVEQPVHSVTEVRLDDAIVRTTWTFEAIAENRTRLTQQMVLEGPGSAAYISMMEDNFGKNIGPGMEKIAREIEKYASE